MKRVINYAHPEPVVARPISRYIVYEENDALIRNVGVHKVEEPTQEKRPDVAFTSILITAIFAVALFLVFGLGK